LHNQQRKGELSLFHGAQATGANVDGFAAFQSDFANVGLPSSIGFTMGVRNVLTEHHALAADTALCHL
jgi:hypothetical protein